MAIALKDLDEILGYDPQSHAVRGIPTLANPLSSAGVNQSTPTAAPKPAGMPSMAPNIQPDLGNPAAPPSGLPSLLPGGTPAPGIPTLEKPKEGFGTKLLHGFEKGAEIAGDVLAPGPTTLIPGTQLHKEWEQGRQAKLAGSQAETGLRQAQTGEAQANTWKALHPLATTPFEAWEQKNPNGNLGDWVNLEQQGGLKTPEERAYQDLLNKGVPPDKALEQVKNSTAGKTPQEQVYASEIAAGKTPEEALAAASKPPADSAAQDTARAEKIRQQQNLKQPVSAEDAAWLRSHDTEKTLGPAATAALRPEQGSYVPVPDPTDPIHKIIGWVDPKSGHFRSLQDIPGMAGNNEIKPTGQAASREEQASVIGRAGDGLIGDIQSNRQQLGNVEAIIKSAFLGTPLSDPKQAGLATEIASFAALQPAMHGFRGSDALKQFEKMIGGIPNNPDSLIASIKAIQKTAGYFNPNGQGASSGETQATHRYNSATGAIEPIGGK